MYHRAFFDCCLLLIVCFHVGQLNGETTKKPEESTVLKGNPGGTEKLFDGGYPSDPMYTSYPNQGYGNMGNYYPNNNQYNPNNRGNNGMGWPNYPQNYPNQGNYPNGPYPSNYPPNQGNGYNQYPNQPLYTNRPYGNQPMDNQYPNQGPNDQGYPPNYNNIPPIQGGGIDPAYQNGYNPNYQPSYPNGPNNYPVNNYPNYQGGPNQNGYPNQRGPNGINNGSPSYPNNNYNGPQQTNRPHSNQESPVQDTPNQNDQNNFTPDSVNFNGNRPDESIPNDTGIDDVASILGKPVTVPQETTPSSSIKFPKSTESASKKQCVQDCQTTTKYEPVCGTDNVTYINPEKFVCARNCGLNVFLLQNGACEDSPQ